jgi:crossover junction endodeoxyribonuclease RusA
MNAPLLIQLRCVPPSVTAQQKRLHIVGGKPVFFHGAQQRAQEETWSSLLMPFVPAEPLDGPLTLSVRLVWPHNSSARKRDRDRLLPRSTRPDTSNVSKHLEDLLTRMRFITDDSRIARLTVEKYHGPEPLVGITIQIAPFPLEDPS